VATEKHFQENKWFDKGFQRHIWNRPLYALAKNQGSTDFDDAS